MKKYIVYNNAWHILRAKYIITIIRQWKGELMRWMFNNVMNYFSQVGMQLVNFVRAACSKKFQDQNLLEIRLQ